MNGWLGRWREKEREESMADHPSVIILSIHSFIRAKGQGEVCVYTLAYLKCSHSSTCNMQHVSHVFLFPVRAAMFHAAGAARVSSGAAGGGSLEVPEENLRLGG